MMMAIIWALNTTGRCGLVVCGSILAGPVLLWLTMDPCVGVSILRPSQAMNAWRPEILDSSM
ncbi:hypothetical protein RSAG8_09701, partial [Rhizoctonia solani AG-8 WAC10335]